MFSVLLYFGLCDLVVWFDCRGLFGWWWLLIVWVCVIWVHLLVLELILGVGCCLWLIGFYYGADAGCVDCYVLRLDFKLGVLIVNCCFVGVIFL